MNESVDKAVGQNETTSISLDTVDVTEKKYMLKCKFQPRFTGKHFKSQI